MVMNTPYPKSDNNVLMLKSKGLDNIQNEFLTTSRDDEESNHEDASDTGATHLTQKQPGMDSSNNCITNIKLPILKKEDYETIGLIERSKYLEYINNDAWKVIQNGNSKKRILTGKDGVIRILPPVTVVEIQDVEKERKAKNILLMVIPKEHMRRFHGKRCQKKSGSQQD
ncbi:hypothetical protein Tco_1335368 [Tanacetum coccineum]